MGRKGGKDRGAASGGCGKSKVFLRGGDKEKDRGGVWAKVEIIMLHWRESLLLELNYYCIPCWQKDA